MLHSDIKYQKTAATTKNLNCEHFETNPRLSAGPAPPWHMAHASRQGSDSKNFSQKGVYHLVSNLRPHTLFGCIILCTTKRETIPPIKP